MSNPKRANGRRREPETHRPDPANQNERLDEALEESFPASDPPQPVQPGVTGWDLEDAAEKTKRKR